MDLPNEVHAVRRVAIYTSPDKPVRYDKYDPIEKSGWWSRDGRWPEFESAMNRIRHLPNLEAIEIRFSKASLRHGFPEHVAGRGNFAEPTEIRFNTLQAVERAIMARFKRSFCQIRELVLENLQNMPLPETAFVKYLIRDIERLHIRTIVGSDPWYWPEWSDRPPGRYYREELREFPLYLQRDFLPWTESNLVELTLGGGGWTEISGEFNGGGTYAFKD
ncbi:hypothetical protein NXS19_008456 [Fusarium pseudograminearum]|nr:hypothetical protein NXS19_008456 [Fusarium pseudograminearum]